MFLVLHRFLDDEDPLALQNMPLCAPENKNRGTKEKAMAIRHVKAHTAVRRVKKGSMTVGHKTVNVKAHWAKRK
jgi:hypothetical protein